MPGSHNDLNFLPGGRFSRPGFILVGALVFLNIYDVIYHFAIERTLSLHQLSEAALVTAITLFAVLLLIRYRRTLGRAGEQLNRFRAEVEQARLEARANEEQLQRFRDENRDILSSLRKAMNDQFERWHFSTEEKRAALLIIQGLSFREIAARLDKSEKTIRNQSLSIYAKSGMTGRNDLAAFFLLDILDIDE